MPQKAVCIRAEATPALDNSWKSVLTCEQTLRAEYSELKNAGYNVTTKAEATDHDLCFCVFTKHKKENYGNVARGLQLLKEGGILVCSGHNLIGARSIEKNIQKELPIEGKLAQNHCRVFWIRKTSETVQQVPDDWNMFHQPQKNIDDTDWFTQPGMFSWNKVDRGSAFLVEHLPKIMRGRVADFGSGWGYLSRQLLNRFEHLKKLDLFENELLALEASRKNLPEDDDRISFNWSNLANDIEETGVYDWVVTNPPFHTSARTDITLGCQFISNAERALKSGGQLLLVANRQLPYESKIREIFPDSDRLAESADFKVLLARK